VATCLRTAWWSETGIFWTLWIAPAFVFLWLVDSSEPGHDLLFTGALCALSAGLLLRAFRDKPRLMVSGAVLVAVQSAVFLFAAPLLDRPLAWTANSLLLNVTVPGLRQQQRSLDDAVVAIRTEFDPRDTVVVTLTGQDPYRFMMYLQEFDVLRLDPQTHTVLSARSGQQGNWTPPTECLFASDGVHHAVWVLWSRSEPGLVPTSARRVSTLNDEPFRVWEVRPSTQTANYLGFTLGGPCAGARLTSTLR
jgi:hypothetical protein